MASGRSNGYCITRSPDSNAETDQMASQLGAVKLMRVRRATAPGGNDPSVNKAVEFMQELDGLVRSKRSARNHIVQGIQQQYEFYRVFLRVESIVVLPMFNDMAVRKYRTD